MRTLICSLLLASGTVLTSPIALAQQPKVEVPVEAAAKVESTQARAKAMAEKAIAFLKSKQDASGGWSVTPGQPTFPAITGLVLQGMLMHEGVTIKDASVAKGVGFILSKKQPDGGFYDKLLPVYNTAICLSALAKVNTSEASAAIKPAQDFLKGLQYGEGAVVIEGAKDSPQKVAKSDPFYGGWGYGNRGRPDMSNTGFALEALRVSGVESSDAAIQRALVFLERCQMHHTVNAMEYAQGSMQGGFIYSTSENQDNVGVGQSFAKNNMIEETLSDGSKASRLRAYGSMTYLGFKSYAYAGLSPSDSRVQLALEWISRNYTLSENPGAGLDGVYYYYLVFARALGASNESMLKVMGADGKPVARDWKRDLVEELAKLQNADGSFRSVNERWMENNDVLITAYALIALQEAAR
ncbi:MAG: terpene cyclase/mutase family protein [Planctomycetes bacterium]|nr:terpene cyclase/mutase family protein [Planctomycetota bacterium]